MRSVNLRVFRICVLACLLFSEKKTSGAAIPDVIAKAIQQNAAQLSPLEISWTSTFSSSFTPDELRSAAKIDPKIAHIFSDKTIATVIWQDGKIYTYRLSEPRGRITEATSDGRVAYMGAKAVTPDTHDRPRLSKTLLATLASNQPKSVPVSADYFQITGLELANRAEDLAKCDSARSRIVSDLAAGASALSVTEVNLDGQETTRVELEEDNQIYVNAQKTDLTTLADELRNDGESEQEIADGIQAARLEKALPAKVRKIFFLDPKMNYAMRRYERRYPDGRLLELTTASDFSRVVDRPLWLPQNGVREMFVWSTVPDRVFEKPVMIEAFAVTKMATDRVASDTFVLSYTAPGTQIADETGPTPLQYEVPASK